VRALREQGHRVLLGGTGAAQSNVAQLLPQPVM
jgi:hypothetical protein